jgi:flagellar protein FlaG
MKVEGQRIATEASPVGKVEAARGRVERSEAQPNRDKTEQRAVVTPRGPEKELRLAAEVMNEAMKIYNYHLQFRVHKASGRIQVKVIDSETEKTVREIPPEQLLDCSAHIKEMIDRMAGILVDEII